MIKLCPQLAKSCTGILAGFAAIGASLVFAGVARAEFTVCNQTLDVVNVAVGQDVNDTIQTEGWWTIGANRCVDVIREELANRFIYIYTTDVFGQPVLEGNAAMCTGSKRFVIRGTDLCWQRGFRAAQYLEIDTQGEVRWTVFIRQPQIE